MNIKELVESAVKPNTELFLSNSVRLSETFTKYDQRYPIKTNVLPLHFKSATFYHAISLPD